MKLPDPTKKDPWALKQKRVEKREARGEDAKRHSEALKGKKLSTQRRH